MKKPYSMYDAMIASQPERPADLKAFFHMTPDQRHVGMVSAMSKPTFQDMVDGWLKFPVHRPAHRKDNGEWEYEVQHLTRAEAEAKVHRFLASQSHVTPRAA